MSVETKIEALQSARDAISGTKAYSRLAKLFDDGIFTEIDTFAGSADSYAEAVAAHGSIDGIGVWCLHRKVGHQAAVVIHSEGIVGAG